MLVAAVGILLLFLIGRAFVIPQAEARLILKHCNTEDNSRCYEQEVLNLFDRGFTMKETIIVVRQILAKDPEFRYCHTLGHKIAGRAVAKDPSHWKKILNEVPSDICSYGFIHGVFQERFRMESFPENFSVTQAADLFEGTCEGEEWKQKTRREGLSCMHALGHLFLYLTRADVPRSIELCERVGARMDQNMRRSCFEGAFMTLYQQLEPEEVALVEGVAPTSLIERDTLCGQFTGLPRISCMLMSFPLDPDATHPERLASFCDVVGRETEEEIYCINFLSYQAMVELQFDVEAFASFCERIENFSGKCLSFGATVLFEADPPNFTESLDLCGRAKSYGEGDWCHKLLVESSVRTFGPSSFRALALCNSLPRGWKNACRERQERRSYNE